MAATTILTVSNLAKTFITEEIFSGVTFQVAEREHVALVGVNGAGKSTVLRIIAGIEHANAGEIVLQTGLRITYLAQESSFTSDNTLRGETRTAFAHVIAIADRMREIEHQMAEAGDDLDALLIEYDALQLRFDAAHGYDIDHRTDEVLFGLGFTEDQFNQPVKQLSGGQKTRVALAKALLADPDLLLLDEPTNHLDLEMLEWLESFLRTWNGACLIVSHDRYFLDRVTTRTLDLSFGRLEDYPAPYARYLTLREERMERRMKEYEEQQEYIARTEEFIRKYGAGQRYREARGRQKKLDRLERIQRPQEHDRLRLRLGTPVRSGRTVLSTTEMDIGYIDPEGPARLIEAPEMVIERGDRIGLLGPNGSGKTTFLKTLMGVLPPLKGEYQFGTNVKPGYYAQSHEQLRGKGSGTPLSVILETGPMNEEYARNYLGRFLFSGDDVYKHISELSGGERSRLALSVLLLEQANFLILDEPTNHLDIHARETLEELLDEFEGTILFVSHDRYFMDRIATKLWVVADESIEVALGNYTDYQRAIGRRDAAPSPPEPETTPEPAPEPTPLASAPEDVVVTAKGKPRRLNDATIQKELGQVERQVAKLEGRLNEISDALAVASIDEDMAAVTRLGEEYEKVQSDLDDAYARWETVSAAGVAV
ncbi:MAG TPA: ABC-F family ATP-binding cassette domain-containing protein [Thermomicrobiales bacterium]|nr:ABC-F family ATP-binding cassette domain-containing protein [Thermomicrobiales bacterium]